MPLRRLTIEIEGSGSPITVDYNPEEYTVNKDNNFAVQGVPGLGSPIVQFVNGNQRTLDITLFFDTWDTNSYVKQDVRELTRPVVDLMRIDGTLHAPPILIVAMASLRLRCVLSRVSEQFTMFQVDGMPVRARLTCTFIEVTDPEQEAKEANLQTADFTKLHVVEVGETLSAIAGDHYEDPRRWRPIALANGISRPSAIAVGDVLVIPSLPYSDLDRDEEVA